MFEICGVLAVPLQTCSARLAANRALREVGLFVAVPATIALQILEQIEVGIFIDRMPHRPLDSSRISINWTH